MAAPVSDSLRAGIAQRHIARTDGMHFGAQHLHALYVGVLTLHIRSSHKYFTLHTHQGAYRCCGYTMLSGTRLGDDARLAHLLCQQDLSHGVVDFVGTRVVQVFALQVQLTTVLLAHAAGKVERRGTSDVVAQQSVILVLELLRLDDGQVLLLQVLHCRVENLGDVGAAELSVITFFVYLIVAHIFKSFCGLTLET